jgi:tetratricopeptide (TPR) repeat protein
LKDFAALERAALAAELAGDAAAMVEARRELAQLEPQSPAARLALARALEKSGDLRAAVQACTEALQRGATAHLQLAKLHARMGKHSLALQQLKKALAAEPANPEALFLTAMCLHRLRRYAEAVRHFTRALEQDPASPQLHFNLALARFEAGDLAGAVETLAHCHALKRGAAAPEFPPEEMAANDVKLQHDLEQLEYLLELGRLPADYRKVADEYRALLQEMRGATGAGVVAPFNVHRYPLVARHWKRPLYMAPGAAGKQPVIDPRLDARKLESEYQRARPGLVVVDGLLTQEALAALRRYCRESTIWNNIQAGYLGAYFFDGFACELVLRIAQELRERLARIVRGLPLQMAWGYKYDATLQGIGVHADAAAVNVNFWITEDDANLEPEGGGLLVYPHKAPADWDFEKFNRDPPAIMRFLEGAGSKPIRVPHRANRAVIFDSDLFHATDALRFREGYLNRRINVTLLYGQRGE